MRRPREVATINWSFVAALVFVMIIATIGVGTTNHHRHSQHHQHPQHHYQHHHHQHHLDNNFDHKSLAQADNGGQTGDSDQYLANHFSNVAQFDDSKRQKLNNNDLLKNTVKQVDNTYRTTTHNIDETVPEATSRSIVNSIPLPSPALSTIINYDDATQSKTNHNTALRLALNRKRSCPRHCSKPHHLQVLKQPSAKYIIASSSSSLASPASSVQPSSAEMATRLTKYSPDDQYATCGSNRQLYPSHCHLRQASCRANVHIWPVDLKYCHQDNSLGLQQLHLNGADNYSQQERKVTSNNKKRKRNSHYHNFGDGDEKKRNYEEADNSGDLAADDQNDIISDIEIDQDDLNEDQDDELMINSDRTLLNKRGGVFYNDNKFVARRQQLFQSSLSSNSNNNDSQLENSVINLQQATNNNNDRQICNRQLFDQMLAKIASLSDKNASEIFRFFDRNNDAIINSHELLLSEFNESTTTWLFDANDNKTKQLKPFRGNYILEPLFDGNPCSLSHILLYEDRDGNDAIDLYELTSAFDGLVTRESSSLGDGIIRTQDNNNEPNNNSVYMRDPSNQIRNIIGYRNHYVNLGDSLNISCNLELPNINEFNHGHHISEVDWLRNGVQLSNQMLNPLQQQQQSLARNNNDHYHYYNYQVRINQNDSSSSSLQFKDIQLFMSGNYTCRRQSIVTNRDYNSPMIFFEENHYLHITVPPRVNVRPPFQWAPIGSQAQLECQYDYLPLLGSEKTSKPLSIRWFKNGQELKTKEDLLYKNLNATTTTMSSSDDSFYEYDSQVSTSSSSYFGSERSIGSTRTANYDNDDDLPFAADDVAQKSAQVSISMSSSKLTMTALTPSDTGSISCQAKLADSGGNEDLSPLLLTQLSSDYGSLLVQDDPAQVVSDDLTNSNREHLWLFHDNGITVYSISTSSANDQMQLIRDFTGHQTIAPQVDNNWNQLTLCGGLNPDETVICEWSDNAVIVKPQQQYLSPINYQRQRHRRQSLLGYVYVGQPNLNRVLVFDSQQFEIVSILNTDPQPKQLWLYNSFVPSSNERHHSNDGANTRLRSPVDNYRHLFRKDKSNQQQQWHDNEINNQLRSDVWILCHGQPLMVDTTPPATPTTAASATTSYNNNSNNNRLSNNPVGYAVVIDDIQKQQQQQNNTLDYYWQQQMLSKEQRLRNRKSVQIIRSTTPPQINHNANNHHRRHADSTPIREPLIDYRDERSSEPPLSMSLKRFKSSFTLTSYHLKSDHPFDLIHDLYMPHVATPLQDNYRHRVQYAYVSHYDERKLVRINMDKMAPDNTIDLGDCVPVYQLTTATGLLIIQCRTPITHQLKGQLILDQLTSSFISYNTDIQAQRSFLTPDHRYLVSIYTDYYNHNHQHHRQYNATATATATSPTSTSSTISATTTTTASRDSDAMNDQSQKSYITASLDHNDIMRIHEQMPPRPTTGGTNRSASSKVIVQRINSNGLEFQYDVNTSLFIVDCQFVWKNGDYSAILVSDLGQQDEILSLRLQDGRVELISGILGRMSYQHSGLKVSERTKLAAIATNKGVYVLDMENNRVKCQVPKHHQFTSATLLWA